jgi:hypothetical protein
MAMAVFMLTMANLRERVKQMDDDQWMFEPVLNKQ